MIVVCTGCSAKFRVADEKVGPRGAKLRCSRCQTVFTVRRDATPPPELIAAPPRAPAPPPPAPAPAPPPPAPAAPSASPQFAADPFAIIAGLDRLPYHPAQPPPPPAPSPFELDLDPPGLPPADPFEPPPAPAPSASDDPFAQLQSSFPGPEPLPPQRSDPFPDSEPGSAHLSLEEQTTPPPRKVRTGASGMDRGNPLGLAGMAGGMEDPFAAVAPLEPGEPQLGAGDGGFDSLSLPGLESGLSGISEPPPPPPPSLAAAAPSLLQVDPFAAAAVKAPLLADERAAAEPAEPGEAPLETTAERRAAGASTLRAVAVNAVSLVALLLVTLAIWLGWRGGVSPKDALRPTTIVAALRPQPAAGPLVTAQVSSGFYERERGAPVVFVRGTVASASPVPLEGVKVSVELLRDGQVLVRGEVPAGVVLGPETLHGVADAPGLARAAAEAAEGATGRLQPGEVAPFLVAFVDDPGALVGASVRITASAGNGK